MKGILSLKDVPPFSCIKIRNKQENESLGHMRQWSSVTGTFVGIPLLAEQLILPPHPRYTTQANITHKRYQQINFLNQYSSSNVTKRSTKKLGPYNSC